MTGIDTTKVREGLALGVPTDPGHLIDLAHDLCDEVDRLRAICDLKQKRREHYQAKYAEQYDRARKVEAERDVQDEARRMAVGRMETAEATLARVKALTNTGLLIHQREILEALGDES